MTMRIDPRATRRAMQAMSALQTAVDNSGLEPGLVKLVSMRASQINGCAHCLDMHSKDARGAGETEQRLYVLDAWREAPFYSERERAALAWTDAVTRLGPDHVDDATFAQARAQFGDEELANLALAVVAINGWNRMAIAFRAEVGSYRVGNKGAQTA